MCKTIDLYIKNYDTFTKKIIYCFDYGMGGIGDFFKFFVYIFDYSIQNNIQLYLLNSHDLNKFVKLKFDKMNLTNNESIALKYQIINNYSELTEPIDKDYIYMVFPSTFYNVQQQVNEKIFKYVLSDIFFFTKEITNCNILSDYISIHLRLGDRYLETEKKFIVCHEDKRSFNNDNIENFIKNNIDKNIYFFCDNNAFKQKIKRSFPKINIFNIKIGHTSLLNVTIDEIKNALREFYVLSKSRHIYYASVSGFSMMASRVYNTKYTEI